MDLVNLFLAQGMLMYFLSSRDLAAIPPLFEAPKHTYAYILYCVYNVKRVGLSQPNVGILAACRFAGTLSDLYKRVRCKSKFIPMH